MTNKSTTFADLPLRHISRPRCGGNLVPIAFAVCCAIVAIVSVHDSALLFLNRDVIGDMELNPIGLWLLELQGGKVWLFIVAKLLGTSLVGTILICIYRCRPNLALICATTLALMQTALLGFLTFV